MVSFDVEPPLQHVGVAAKMANWRRGTLPDGTVAGGMWVRATFCFQKVAGTWLVTHDQVSVPFDLATGRGLTDLEP